MGLHAPPVRLLTVRAVVIQNTTFGGVQGFTLRPSTPWYDDDGALAGVVHQERNWTYVLAEGVGHLVAYNNPSRVRPPPPPPPPSPFRTR